MCGRGFFEQRPVAVEYIIDDEFVEITPDAIRMGKREKEKDKSGRVKK